MKIEANSNLQGDPVILRLMEKLPINSRESFSEDQLLALKIALGGRTWGVHAVDFRWTLRFWRWHYYFVFLAGRNRRSLSRKELNAALFGSLILLMIVVTFLAAIALLSIYLVKSALGIDLLPGFSLGIWGWFQQSVLR